MENLDLYDIIWGSSSATGNFVVPSANPYLGRDGGEASYDDLYFEDDLTTNTGPRSGEKRVGTSDRGQNKRNKGKGKLSYEDNITAMTIVYIAKQERDVSSRESR